MDIGFGAALALWLASGVAFWAAFVVLGLRFRAAEEGHAPSPGLARGSESPARPTADQVFARTGL